jgi:hypothetical protein
MINELISIILRSLKLDKSLYNNSKNFGEEAIYFSSIIVIIAGLSSIIPQSIFIKTLVINYNINNIEPARITFALMGSLLAWFILSSYIYIVGVKINPSKKTNCSLRKILSVVGFAQSPLIFRCFAVSSDLLVPVIILTYIWYVVSLTFGINEILNYKSKIKAFLLIFAPIIILFIFVFLNN